LDDVFEDGAKASEDDGLGEWLENILEDGDDVGYYENDDWDDYPVNAADGTFCPEALDSCWDNSF
jgi:hypothetical protein